MIAPASRLLPRDNVFSREFDGELVVLDLDAGVYYGFNGVASDAWHGLCESGKTVREVASEMVGRYQIDETTLMNDLLAVANEFVAKGLARVVSP